MSKLFKDLKYDTDYVMQPGDPITSLNGDTEVKANDDGTADVRFSYIKTIVTGASGKDGYGYTIVLSLTSENSIEELCSGTLTSVTGSITRTAPNGQVTTVSGTFSQQEAGAPSYQHAGNDGSVYFYESGCEIWNGTVGWGTGGTYTTVGVPTTGVKQIVTEADLKQPDWNQTNTSSIDYIKNKPTLGNAASKNTGTTSGTVATGDHTHSSLKGGNYTASLPSMSSNKTLAFTTDIPSAATSYPEMDGSAAVGTSSKWAKEDHVHPTDTSRASSSHTHSSLKNGNYTASLPTLSANKTLAMSDHTHNSLKTGSYTASLPTLSANKTLAVTTDIPSAATSTPLMDGTAAVGTSTKWAKEDHVHPTDTSRAAASHTHTASAVTDLGSLATKSVALAAEFSTSTPYAVGAMVMYQGTLYRCSSVHSAGAWNSSHFTAVTLSSDFLKTDSTNYAQLVKGPVTFNSDCSFGGKLSGTDFELEQSNLMLGDINSWEGPAVDLYTTNGTSALYLQSSSIDGIELVIAGSSAYFTQGSHSLFIPNWAGAASKTIATEDYVLNKAKALYEFVVGDDSTPATTVPVTEDYNFYKFWIGSNGVFPTFTFSFPDFSSTPALFPFTVYAHVDSSATTLTGPSGWLWVSGAGLPTSNFAGKGIWMSGVISTNEQNAVPLMSCWGVA